MRLTASLFALLACAPLASAQVAYSNQFHEDVDFYLDQMHRYCEAARSFAVEKCIQEQMNEFDVIVGVSNDFGRNGAVAINAKCVAFGRQISTEIVGLQWSGETVLDFRTLRDCYNIVGTFASEFDRPPRGSDGEITPETVNAVLNPLLRAYLEHRTTGRSFEDAVSSQRAPTLDWGEAVSEEPDHSSTNHLFGDPNSRPANR